MAMYDSRHWMNKIRVQGCNRRKLHPSSRIRIDVRYRDIKGDRILVYVDKSSAEKFCTDMFDLSLRGYYISQIKVSKNYLTYDITIRLKQSTSDNGFDTNIDAQFLDFASGLILKHGYG